MTTATLTDTDRRVRDDVEQELEWDPEVDSSALGVLAKDGSVTLAGFIDTYAGKLAAERAAKRVQGVRAVANDIGVRLRLERSDTDIAQDATRALEFRTAIPDTVQAVVRNGHVTLTGVVDWLFQQRIAEDAIRHIRGVRGIFNHIQVAPPVNVGDVRERISKALHQNADVDARRIEVNVSGHTAVLTGSAGSWLQREAAERAASNAPGIARVDNRITIRSHEHAADAG